METTTTTIISDSRTKKCFADQNVLLTGASGGLGRALALQLAACNVRSIVLSGRKEEALERVKEECIKIQNGLTVHIVPCDLGDSNAVEKLGVKAMELCGGVIDVLINNGGVSSRSNFVDTKLEVDERLMQINFLSGASLAKQVVPAMAQNYQPDMMPTKKIIWISSVLGLVGLPSRISYVASKFAVQGYCEGLRAELAPSGIGVYVASPGYIRTGISKAAITGDGSPYGKTHPNTEQGADPNKVAMEILTQVAKGRADFLVTAPASAKVAIWMRLLCPGILQNVLVKLFLKAQKELEEQGVKSKSD